MAQNWSKSVAATRTWLILKCVVVAIVLYFVGRRAFELWNSVPPQTVSIQFGWLIPAGLIYFIGWLPSVWFWKSLLHAMHQPVSWADAIRAYYIGNLGKYIPGKAMVLIIRASLLKEVGVGAMLAGVTALYETLVFMATGLALAVALSATAVDDALWSHLPAAVLWLRGKTGLIFLVTAIFTFVSTPVTAWIFTRVARKAVARNASSNGPAPAISPGLMCQGIIATSLGWSCHALSLGLVLQAVSGHRFDLSQFPIWLEACATSVVVGFVVLIAPGGIGVREGLLIETLKDQPQIGPVVAILAAAVLRAVWFFTELAVAAVLLVARRRGLASILAEANNSP